MKPSICEQRGQRGAALAMVMLTLGLITSITAAVVHVVTNRFAVLHQSSAWQEAFVASEAGIHQAMAQLERGLKQNALPTGSQVFTLDLPHLGESSAGAVEYTLARNDVKTASRTRVFYSIVSKGSANLPGSRVLSMDSRDVVLRKLDLAGSSRKATRTIEAWAKPLYSTDTALQVDKLILLNNHKIAIDSFNSDDPNRSIAPGLPGLVGQFNVAPHNILAAHIATNDKFISAGDATVYGDALTNGGTVGGSAGILGEIRDDFYQPLAPVFAPEWASAVTPGVPIPKKGTVLHLTSATTLLGGTEANPGRYILDSVSLTGSADVLTFDFGLNGTAGSPDPSKKHVELYVRGDISTKGATGSDSGTIVVVDGVQVKLWVQGNTTISGNGMSNQNGRAAGFALYGINAPIPTPNQTFTLAGTARFFGTVYAPSAHLKLAGGGSDGMFVGSLVGLSATLNGHTKIRYDEALAGTGLIKRFDLATWFEDTKKQGAFPGTL